MPDSSDGSVGVVIVTFDRRAEARILASDWLGSARQIVVVDNSPGNAETTHSVSDQLTTISSGLNLGFGTAVNLGAAYLRDLGCTSLVIANDDLSVSPTGRDWADKVAQALHPSEITVLQTSGQSGGWDLSIPTAMTIAVFGYRLGMSVPWIKTFPKGALLICRMDDFISIGGYDEEFFLYWEEWDLFKRWRSKFNTSPTSRNCTGILHQGGATTMRYPSLSGAAYGLSCSLAIRRLRRFKRVRSWIVLTGFIMIRLRHPLQRHGATTEYWRAASRAMRKPDASESQLIESELRATSPSQRRQLLDQAGWGSVGCT